ncbi:MAG TPA: YqeG family HAD IIIA-type phosphatase [Armatimonadota bacterium]|nr:YqeG family HAD IIIA-type phosphatase [Armatimonadota bacterium]
MRLATRLIDWCRPDLKAASVSEIDLEALRARGITALLLDLDNTLVRWRRREIRPEIAAWIQRARELRFQLYIVSNAGHARRVAPVAQELDVPFIVRAVKPRRRAFRWVAAQLKVAATQTAVIGDQIFTDIVGGNRAGMVTVLVAPLDRKREFFWTKCMRVVENRLLSWSEKRGARAR